MKQVTEKILGVAVPVLIEEMETNIFVETILQFRHPALHLFDVRPQVDLWCTPQDGCLLLQGTIKEDVYYIGFVDSIMYHQTHRQAFHGLAKSPKIKPGMTAQCQAIIPPGQIVSTIINNTHLQQSFLITIKLVVSKEEIIPRSLVVPVTSEQPICQTLIPTEPAAAVYGPEAVSELPDFNEEDASAVLSVDSSQVKCEEDGHLDKS